MAPRVLVLNAGSSTLKASIVDAGDPRAGSDVEPPPPIASVSIELGDDASRGADVAGAFDAVMAELGRAGGLPEEVEAVAHRVVHGGSTYTGPTVIDDRVLAGIDALTPLAPLHQPVAVATIRAAMDRLTEPPHVAVFDTAFHATIAESAWRYPVPRAWDEWGIRRYGFHGLSVAWSVERASALFGRPVGELGLVVAHLGNGCSVTAVAGGRSVATSMGLTPLEGLMMGTRSGSIDPGIIVGLVRDGRLDLDEMADALDHRSGLLGISGSSGDMRSLEAAADGGDTAASLAIAMFVERAAAAIAAASTSLERLHAVVFTGGIGSGSGRVRSAIVARLAVLGIAPLDGGDDRAERDGIVAASDGSSPAVLRIEAREDVVAARAAVDAIPAR
jgi:acetate kinase